MLSIAVLTNTLHIHDFLDVFGIWYALSLVFWKLAYQLNTD